MKQLSCYHEVTNMKMKTSTPNKCKEVERMIQSLMYQCCTASLKMSQLFYAAEQIRDLKQQLKQLQKRKKLTTGGDT